MVSINPLKISIKQTLVFFLLLIVSGMSLAIEKVNEDQLKSIYLYNFAKFISWPDERFADNPSEFRICLLGKDTLSKYLKVIASEQKLNDRNVKLIKPNNNKTLDQCHIIFFKQLASDQLQNLLDITANKNILTVSDQHGFAEDGGIIEFFNEGSRLKFIINLDSAERTKLKFRANLLSLSKTIRDQ